MNRKKPIKHLKQLESLTKTSDMESLAWLPENQLCNSVEGYCEKCILGYISCSNMKTFNLWQYNRGGVWIEPRIEYYQRMQEFVKSMPEDTDIKAIQKKAWEIDIEISEKYEPLKYEFYDAKRYRNSVKKLIRT